MSKSYYIYILSSISRRLYIGITNNLIRRIFEHKESIQEKLNSSKNDLFKIDLALNFTTRYNIDQLIYFEQFESAEAAITREKQLKGWTRNKKLKLIQKTNPDLKDLYPQLI